MNIKSSTARPVAHVLPRLTQSLITPLRNLEPATFD
jgi:hypothetical protein